MSLMNRAMFPALMDVGIDTLAGLNYNRYKSVYGQIFETKKLNDRDYWQYTRVTGMGAARTRGEGEATEYDSMKQSWSAFVQVSGLSLGFAITREAIKDNRYIDVMAQGAKELAKGHWHAKETLHAGILNLANDATNLGGDGSSLASNSHPAEGPGIGNQRNIPAINGTFGYLTLQQAMIDIATMVDEKGIPINLRPIRIIYPPALMGEIEQVMKNPYEPNTTNRNSNVLGGMGLSGISAVMWTYLTDPKKVFIQTDADDGLVTIMREPFETNTWPEKRNYTSHTSSYERIGAGWGEWRSVYVFGT